MLCKDVSIGRGSPEFTPVEIAQWPFAEAGSSEALARSDVTCAIQDCAGFAFGSFRRSTLGVLVSLRGIVFFSFGVSSLGRERFVLG